MNKIQNKRTTKKLIMLFTFISIIIPNVLSASNYGCSENIEERKPIGLTDFENQSTKEVNLKCFPLTMDTSKPEECNWETTLVFNSDNIPTCLHYESNSKELMTQFKKNKIIAKWAKEQNAMKKKESYNKFLKENKSQLKGKLNKEIIETPEEQTLLDKILPYLPSLDTDDLMKKLASPGSVGMDYAIDQSKKSEKWKKCDNQQLGPLPTISLPNINKMVLDQTKKIDDALKKQASAITDEIYGTLFDLTSDEAVIQYVITGVSNLVAMGSCSIKSAVPTPDSSSLQTYGATAKYSVKGTAATGNNTPSVAKQSEKEKASGCFFAIGVVCTIPSPISGAGVGTRGKVKKAQGNHASKQADAAGEALAEAGYNECMKTEPAKIEKKIMSMLSNAMNGVNIELFAIKECTDSHFKASFHEGDLMDLNKDDKEIRNNMIEKILNSGVSYLEEKEQGASGFINGKLNELRDFINYVPKKQKLQKKYKKIQEKYANTLAQSSEIGRIIDRALIDKSYSREILYNLDYTKKTLQNILNKRVSLLENIGKILEKTEKVSLENSDSKMIVKYSEKRIKDYEGYLSKIFNTLTEKQELFQEYGCVKYEVNPSTKKKQCMSFGMKNVMFAQLDQIDYNYFNQIILDGTPLLKRMGIKNYASVLNYSSNLDMNDKNTIINNTKFLIDKEIYNHLKSGLIDLKYLETQYDFQRMTQIEKTSFLKANNYILNIFQKYRE